MQHHVARGRLTPEALDAFRAGDDAFLGEMVRVHEPQLRRCCRGFPQYGDEEDELFQATLVRAWEHRAQYAARGTIEGWLLTVARKTCHAAARHRGHQVGLTAIEHVVAPEPVDGVTLREQQDIEDDQLSIILKLSQRRLMVTVDRLGFEHSVAETAAALGLSTGTVKATLHQARRWLEPYTRTTPRAD